LIKPDSDFFKYFGNSSGKPAAHGQHEAKRCESLAHDPGAGPLIPSDKIRGYHC